MKTWINWALIVGWCTVTGLAAGETGFIARVGQSGEYLDLEHQASGQIIKNFLPLHQAGAVRYFSAGVGLEERSAEYPPFSLKLVFTAGGKPYLSSIDVTITQAQGGAAISIPRDQVEGPWLFVDLPSGTYNISAMQGDRRQALAGIKVETGKQKTVHLRWAEDVGAIVKAPNE